MTDTRNITTGWEIPSEGYCDQPYVIINEDGSWVCTLTTGKGREGERGQHVVSTISTDQGRTWSDPVDIEPADGPEASWALPLKCPDGRIYAFYTYNKDNVREVRADMPGGVCQRVDSLGVYAYKFSDDNARTWSDSRYEIPMRLFDIDRENVYGGRILFFWGVGKPFIHGSAVYLPSSKVGGFGKGFFTRTEGMILKSSNLLTQTDPSKHRWETLPDGRGGLRAPDGPIAEEHNVTPLGDGSLYCTYRTTQGYSCHAYSSDGGHTWTPPEYMTYRPGGRRVKNPRAANFVRRFSNGRFIYWFENHSGTGYDGRNPAWLCGGTEKSGRIHWSQPEIVLYHDDPEARISYPDFIEQNGRYFITETQKTVARVHEIDPALLQGMWNQAENRRVATEGLVLDLNENSCTPGSAARMPRLPDLSHGKGFSLDFWVAFENLSAGQVLFDTRKESGEGIGLSVTDRRTIQIAISGKSLRAGLCESAWDCDPGLLKTGTLHHVVVTVDGGPRVITFVVDGTLCDGGADRQFGWSRFHPELRSINAARKAKIAPTLNGKLKRLRFYDRYLRTSEAVGNYLAGR